MRLHSFLSAALASLVSSVTAVPANTVTRADGSISLVKDQPLFTFNYATSTPNDKNWIGLYKNGEGPENQVQVSPSLKWDWATGSSGVVTIDASQFEIGTYQAYFLADDGYKWLADPIKVDISPKTTPTLIVTEFTTQNARQGDKFSAKVGGLLTLDSPKSDFSKVTGDRWVQVSTDGTLSGTPPRHAKDAHVVVKVSAGGSDVQVKVTIPVRKAGAPLVETLTVLSWNLWHGGTQVNDYHRKQVEYLVGTGADIVGFQESTGDHAIRLATALGWYAHQSRDVGTISRYPITNVSPDGSVYNNVLISLDGKKSQINIWNAHLGYDPYGPYDFCFDKMATDKVLDREAQSGRTPQIEEIVANMKDQISNAHNIPVLLVGDFNAPSHLDWTKKASKLHCGVYDVPWPTSIQPTNAGLADSYREANKNPVSDPAITWSPIFLDNNGRPEPLDRIDFIYHKGLKTLASFIEVVGNPTPEPNHQNNEWTSDHKSVKTVFRVRS